jgi:hypothetical protein
MKHVLGALIPLALTTAGCAAGAWLEGPSEADLPLDPPAHAYPTAVRRPAVPDAAPAARMQIGDDEPQPEPPTITLDPNPPPQAPPHHSRIEQPQVTAPALAVVPPQYRKPAPTNNTPPASATAPPQATVAVSTGPITPLAQAVNAAEPPLAPIVSASDVKSPVAPAATSVSPTSSHAALTAAQRAAEIERLRASLIDALEAEIRERRQTKPTDEELPRLEQELRVAYLQAGRLDDAVAAIDALDPPQRDAYQDLMFGLGVWLSPDEARRVPLRSAKVLRSLREATTDLAGSSKLELKNLAFCERVEHYGGYAEFPRNEFAPKQQVLLYVEVENFAAEHRSAAGYETELQGRYTVFDGRGNIVAERELPLDKSICRNYRRDYYLVYPLYMPDAISPGRYRLELSLEDRKASGKYEGRKFGEGIIEFTIR